MTETLNNRLLSDWAIEKKEKVKYKLLNTDSLIQALKIQISKKWKTQEEHIILARVCGVGRGGLAGRARGGGAAAEYSAAILEDPVFLELEKQAEAEPWWIKYPADGRSSGYLKPEG